MAKQSYSYPLRIYDTELWKRIQDKAKSSGNSINKELEIAMKKHAPEPKKLVK